MPDGFIALFSALYGAQQNLIESRRGAATGCSMLDKTANYKTLCYNQLERKPLINRAFYKNTLFARFARRQGISDKALCEAIERGLIDADLGGGVIKQRIARPGEGRSGGFRSLILFRTLQRAIFAFGFAKNQLDNISEDNLKALKLVAKTLLEHDDEQTEELVEKGELTEVKCDEEDL